MLLLPVEILEANAEVNSLERLIVTVWKFFSRCGLPCLRISYRFAGFILSWHSLRRI